MIPTMLDMINSTLIDMGRPAVETMGGSVDAQRVEQVYKQVYRSLLSRKLWPYRQEVGTLHNSGDATKPTVMMIPDNIERVDVVMYGYEGKREIDFVEPDVFLSLHQGDGTNKVRVAVSTSGSVYVNNDGPPSMWTSFDDKAVVFNAYDSSKETTMNSSNCMIIGHSIPSWPTSAEDRLDIPTRHFGMYDSLARAACHEKIRKEASPVDSYWGGALYGRLLHESRTAGDQKGARTRYGRR